MIEVGPYPTDAESLWSHLTSKGPSLIYPLFSINFSKITRLVSQVKLTFVTDLSLGSG